MGDFITLNDNSNNLYEKLIKLEDRFTIMENKFSIMENKFSIMENKIDQLTTLVKKLWMSNAQSVLRKYSDRFYKLGAHNLYVGYYINDDNTMNENIIGIRLHVHPNNIQQIRKNILKQYEGVPTCLLMSNPQ